MSQDKVIAVDLGGTHIRVALVDTQGQLIERETTPTMAQQGPEAVVSRMVAQINELAERAGIAPQVPVGVASPGPLNPRTGVVLFTPNLPDWRDFPLAERLTAGTGRTTHLANDGNCGALGEAWFGSARGVENLVYLALGTGVGGGIIANGTLIDGARGLGAEVGHVTLAMDGPRCTCGSIGCLESFVSGWAIQRDGEAVATTADGDVLRALAGDGPVHAGVVGRAAEQGDPAAQLILARAGRALGAAIGVFINLFNPEMIVIGGGVATLGDHLRQPAIDWMRTYSFIDMRSDVTISWSSLGADTGLCGAAALAFQQSNGSKPPTPA